MTPVIFINTASAPFILPKDCPRHGRVWAEYREEK